jgi:hypothetical protein
MIRLVIGRILLWFTNPAETERDQGIRERSVARRAVWEAKQESERPEREASSAAFAAAATKLESQLAQRRLASSASAADNLV